MPVYEYSCARCERPFTALVRMGGDPPACPGCGRRKAERLLSTFTAGPGRQAPSDFTPAKLRRDTAHRHH